MNFNRKLPFSLRRRFGGKPALPGALRVYAIGDVHGCLDRLEILLEKIECDSRTASGDVLLVFLGDYIDRGPDSAGVLRRLVEGPLPGVGHHFLMGNHEAALLDCLSQKGEPAHWLRFGGLQTIKSYGGNGASADDRRAFAEYMRRLVPKSHLDFMRNLKDSFRVGDYFFAHAGVRPGVRLDRQRPVDLQWIRGEFLESETPHPAVIVHGHTVAEAPQVHSNRIGVDTGCYLTGRLTAAVLENSTVRFLSTPWILAAGG